MGSGHKRLDELVGNQTCYSSDLKSATCCKFDRGHRSEKQTGWFTMPLQDSLMKRVSPPATKRISGGRRRRSAADAMKRSIEEDISTTIASTTTTNMKKPVFLTKAQREQLALQRRQEEITDRSAVLNNSYSKPAPPPPTTPPTPPPPTNPQIPLWTAATTALPETETGIAIATVTVIQSGETAIGTRGRGQGSGLARLEKLAEREREKELESIKEQYLGSKKPKKRVIKPSEKFRFSFDWENTEDTSRDMNSLYQNPHEAQLLFGRGFRAGMDRREQKKLAAKNEKEMREEIRKKEALRRDRRRLQLRGRRNKPPNCMIL
ncbi:DEAD-box ATP-dependent RNA helicase 21 [Vitis vinifera]|uniref:DEAD-box ATP-dependent RNA helicase 21 n=1 Tax=Vitis vinifera TaxID=29760 RepID=A0A438GS42_VITVI|nr:DEAD-box ATP-dependent RNA helicase 21 [Vitis vinifera]